MRLKPRIASIARTAPGMVNARYQMLKAVLLAKASSGKRAASTNISAEAVWVATRAKKRRRSRAWNAASAGSTGEAMWFVVSIARKVCATRADHLTGWHEGCLVRTISPLAFASFLSDRSDCGCTPMTKTTFTALAYTENDIDEALLKRKLGRALISLKRDSGQVVLEVSRDNWMDAAQTLRDDPELKFTHFTDITAADLAERPDFEPERRFQVIAIVYSPTFRKRVRMKVFIPENDPWCHSLHPVFKGADFTEREVFEMFGIRFRGHPNLKRLLTPEYMKDFPLRKDYPVTGKGERDNFPRYEEIQ
jgi:NADH-quinone oxidoreductase subunit C